MRVAVVPAQVTTVEDRIAGNIGLTQLLLLSTPMFGGGALFVILPPFFHSAVYKLVLITILLLLCGLLAIRVKGKLLLFWLLTLLRYNLRPRYYVYNKQSLHGREMYEDSIAAESEHQVMPVTATRPRALSLSPTELITLQNLIEDPTANLTFETTKKGGLYVRLTEVESES